MFHDHDQSVCGIKKCPCIVTSFTSKQVIFIVSGGGELQLLHIVLS